MNRIKIVTASWAKRKARFNDTVIPQEEWGKM
jgi:hypothetical protein